MDHNNYVQEAEETFFLDYFNTDWIFKSIERVDYVFLHAIRTHAGERGKPGRAYLADLAKDLNIPIPSISRTVEHLQDSGLVQWKTDRSAGQTYVKLSSKAVELMEDERAHMHAAYERITAEIDKRELDQALGVIRKITEILKETA